MLLTQAPAPEHGRPCIAVSLKHCGWCCSHPVGAASGEASVPYGSPTWCVVAMANSHSVTFTVENTGSGFMANRTCHHRPSTTDDAAAPPAHRRVVASHWGPTAASCGTTTLQRSPSKLRRRDAFVNDSWPVTRIRTCVAATTRPLSMVAVSTHGLGCAATSVTVMAMHSPVPP